MNFRTLINRGYFPIELPPPFIPYNLGAALDPNPPGLPTKFMSDKTLAEHATHSLTRVGGLRRELGIPNPVSQFRLTREITDKWSDIQQHFHLSDLSASTPTRTSYKYRALLPKRTHRGLALLRTRHRLNSKFILRTDIAQFYPSLYTHAIPWALHSRPIAKAQRRDMKLLGNRLDLACRNSQDGQTVGIPIGPDTSLVLAELVLSSIDNALRANLGATPSGFRFVDDYELTFRDIGTAEQCLHQLERLLGHFQLNLNPRKTEIVPLPQAFEAAWAIELTKFQFNDKPNALRNDVLRYFSRAFELARLNADDSVLRFAISRLRGVAPSTSSWGPTQHLLLQSISAEPGTIPYALTELVRHTKAGMTPNKDAIAESLNLSIALGAPLGHGQEVAWALWGLIAFHVPLTRMAATACCDMRDSVVALLALDANSRGLVPTGLDTQTWQQSMHEKDLYGPMWLLAFEAACKGWLSGQTDFVGRDPCFAYLRARGVSFYRQRQAALVLPPAIVTRPTQKGDLSL